MNLAQVQEIYQQFARSYDRELREDMRYLAYLETPQLVIDALGERHANVLDLGCGTGLSSMLFLERGWHVTGIEGTRAMIRQARKLPFAKIIQQDLESPWRVADDSFDAVVMIGVMEYIARPGALFRQARRKLVKGGVMGVTVPYKNKGLTDSGLKSYYKQDVTPMVSQAGLRIEQCHKSLGYEDAGHRIQYLHYLLSKV